MIRLPEASRLRRPGFKGDAEMEQETQERPKKTIVAVLASHDSVQKNRELAALFKTLYGEDRKVHKKKEESYLLSKFHFVFTEGTFRRLVLGQDTENPRRKFPYPIEKKVKDFLLKTAGVTVFPDRKEGGVTILANLIVQRQCSIIWPFLSPITVHWLNPENLALMRLCDLWNVKRLMNAESVSSWFRYEAKRDRERNPQPIPLKMTLGTLETEKSLPELPPWPEARRERGRKYHQVKPKPEDRSEDFWSQFEKQTIALVAHDAMKDRMVDFAIQYENELTRFGRILATGTTGQEVENACRKLREDKKIKRCLSGPKGGDIEIATEILFGRCHTVVFFIDPLRPHPHIDDIRVVFSACMAEIKRNHVRMLTNEVQAREWIEEAVRRRA